MHYIWFISQLIQATKLSNWIFSQCLFFFLGLYDCRWFWFYWIFAKKKTKNPTTTTKKKPSRCAITFLPLWHFYFIFSSVVKCRDYILKSQLLLQFNHLFEHLVGFCGKGENDDRAQKNAGETILFIYLFILQFFQNKSMQKPKQRQRDMMDSEQWLID